MNANPTRKFFPFIPFSRSMLAVATQWIRDKNKIRTANEWHFLSCYEVVVTSAAAAVTTVWPPNIMSLETDSAQIHEMQNESFLHLKEDTKNARSCIHFLSLSLMLMLNRISIENCCPISSMRFYFCMRADSNRNCHNVFLVFLTSSHLMTLLNHSLKSDFLLSGQRQIPVTYIDSQHLIYRSNTYLIP